MIEFFVAGEARPQGNKRAGWNNKTGKAFVRETTKGHQQWRDLVAYTAQTHARTLIVGPVRLDLDFRMPRPKSLPKTRQLPHTKKPDALKLGRAVEDAITHVLIRDDSQVTELHVTKRYARLEEPPGVLVRLTELDVQQQTIPARAGEGGTQ